MRAELTTFFGSLSRARQLVERWRFHGLGRLATPSDFRARQRAGPRRPVLFVVGYRRGRPFQTACRERYRLVGSNPCLVTTTVLRCPLAVSVAWRFLTSSSAWRWVENEPKRSSPMRTHQPTLVGSTRKIVVIACLATNECSTNRRRSTPHRQVTFSLRPVANCPTRPRADAAAWAQPRCARSLQDQ
jgi:hypothetical protein